MSSLEILVRFLVAIGVLIAAVSNYLIINKLWKRKHLKDVAESVSISAALLGLATAVPLLIQGAFYDETPIPALKTGIGIVTGIVFVLIGSGMWVGENQRISFLRLMLKALRLERDESADLLKALLQPKGAEQILRILELMAKLDRNIHEAEIELLQDFARRWKIDPPTLSPGAVEEDGTLLDIRSAVETYLELNPPFEQAAQLVDVLKLFAEADEDVSRVEQLVLDEVTGIIESYVGGDVLDRQFWEIVIVPQSPAQFDAVESLLPGARPSQLRGGRVFSVGRFFSSDYAEAISQKYISLGLFTTIVRN
ncbi:MAG: TerB family tellurite resistance protein [Deltaproteobacteria bacterium]|jgi:hypothetical protein|nr:TerB family tellurite resistance protein [Deltaproteobacteria bacterium]MBW2500021.1 TerB family tellurite resistance protein [Deltaproteobacteria bacterium]